MAQKTDRSSLPSPSGLGIDYALVVTAASAALIALIYLILI